MGKLVEGVWQDVWYDTKSTGGKFVRANAKFRNWITPDGKHAPSGKAFKAEAGRYHLYVSYACPWAHRTLIFRKLKGLEDMISVSVVNPFMGSEGWTFHEGDGVIPDPVMNAEFLHQVYTKAEPKFSGRVTVPVLWDKKTETIVSNESSEIIRMFNSAFDHLGATVGDFYPKALRAEIDEVNDRVYHTVNNGVYKCGFATTQEAYEEAFGELFDTLDWLEERLSKQRYLVGDQITEADWRLFTTLLRFDPVYFGHFKTNLRRIVDYPSLWGFTRELYQVPGVKDTVNMHHIKHHYYGSHESINPSRIVPLGPVIDYDELHGRDTSLDPAADAAE
ncbi:MAG: glutathione S-transferase family protein [Myxococcales bacterium]|nr:glutathione S-transferase family protein [Myxococcales bacterium]MDH3486041.1 glutathione S-transferase family protein [Myxococcales bacterium]